MAMASWCESCGAVYLEGEPYVPNCAACTPGESREESWSIQKAIAVSVVVGASVWVAVIYGLLWVLQ